MEKQHQNESPADVRAAEKMAKLWRHQNSPGFRHPIQKHKEVHNLNVFSGCFLFFWWIRVFWKGTVYGCCSTPNKMAAIKRLSDHLLRWWTPSKTKGVISQPICFTFPYVNGGLSNKHTAPNFTRKKPAIGNWRWQIGLERHQSRYFGSMIQAVIRRSTKCGLGMPRQCAQHYERDWAAFFEWTLRRIWKQPKATIKSLNALLHRNLEH